MKISLKKLSCKEVCPDIPVFDFGESLWPNTLNLNFKEKYWALLTNNKYHLKVSGTIEKILIRPISGKLKYKRSEQILILSFRKEWKHSYHIIFNDRDSLLVLSKLEK